MIGDFLDQLEMDLRTAIEENENPEVTLHNYHDNLRYFYERYGQYGGFVPMGVCIVENGDSDETARQLVAEGRVQKLRTYRAELEHLLGLRDRITFALECCNRPRQQFQRILFVKKDGSVKEEDQWEDVEKVSKRITRSTVMD